LIAETLDVGGVADDGNLIAFAQHRAPGDVGQRAQILTIPPRMCSVKLRPPGFMNIDARIRYYGIGLPKAEDRQRVSLSKFIGGQI